MNRITFTVLGTPFGKGAPKTRAFNVPGRAHPIVTVYKDKQTRNYLTSVAQSYWTKANDVPPTDGPVGVTIRAYFAMPKSYAKEMRLKVAEESVPQCVKPDSDNIAKSVCDGLKGVAWRDDSQVTTLIVVKRYSDHPRVEVDIDRYVNWREICATIVHNMASCGAASSTRADGPASAPDGTGLAAPTVKGCNTCGRAGECSGDGYQNCYYTTDNYRNWQPIDKGAA